MRKISWNTGRAYDDRGQLIVAGLMDEELGRWMMLDLSRGIEYLYDLNAERYTTDSEVKNAIMKRYDHGGQDVHDGRRYQSVWSDKVAHLKMYASECIQKHDLDAKAIDDLYINDESEIKYEDDLPQQAPKLDMDSDLIELRAQAYDSDQRTGHVWVMADNTTQKVFALTLLARNCIGTDWRMWGDVPEDFMMVRGGRFSVSEALQFWLYDGEATTNDEVEFDRHKLVVLAEKQFDGVTDHAQALRKVFTTMWGRKIGA
jgi:hypothetical protein